MNNSLVQQSLIDIEQNLKNLKSARDQVNSVSLSSQQLVEAISSILKVLEGLDKNLIKERVEFTKKIEKEIKNFQFKLETGAENAINQSSKFHDKHGVEIDKTIHKLSSLQKEVALLQKEISTLDLDLKFTSVNDSIKSFDKELKQVKSEIDRFSSRFDTWIELQNDIQTERNQIVDEKLEGIKSSNQIILVAIIIATVLLAILGLVF